MKWMGFDWIILYASDYERCSRQFEKETLLKKEKLVIG